MKSNLDSDWFLKDPQLMCPDAPNIFEIKHIVSLSTLEEHAQTAEKEICIFLQIICYIYLKVIILRVFMKLIKEWKQFFCF